MLSLLLLRHAKSSWGDPSLDDFERPLAERGIEAAPRIGRYMAAEGLKPDLIVCSSAERTRQTLGLVLPALPGAVPAVTYDDDTYLATATALLAHVKRMPAGSQCVMLVGHNPGLHDLAVRLAGSGDGAAMRAMSEKFPTAGFAVLDFAFDQWSQVAARTGKLRSFVTPRSLKP